MIIRPADFVKDDAFSFQSSVLQIVMQAVFNFRCDDRHTLFRVPSEVKIDFRINVARHIITY